MRQNSTKNRNKKIGNGAITGAKKKNTSKGRKKNSFKNTRLFKIIRLILIIILMIIIINVIKNLFHKNPTEVGLIIGDKKIDLVNDIIIDKYNNIYMSIDDVKKLYDSNIYYNNKILITTYNMHIAVLELEKTTMKVNDVVQEIKGTLQEKNGVTYLPFSDMEDVYDFSENYNKETKILSIDSKFEEKKEAVVLKNAKLKESAKTFSKTIENVKKSQYVTVFETSGDYSKVRTKAGNIGFIKTKKISKPELLWETMDEEKIDSINILEEYAIVDSKYEILSNVKENTIVTPSLFNIIQTEDEKTSVESIIDLEGTKFQTYKDWAKGSNITICPIVNLSCSMSKVCSSYESRSNIINTLYNNMVNNKLSMICIDFKEIDDIEGLYRFITEMIPRFKCAGMKVLIKNNNALNKERLNNIVDYVID